MSVTLKDGSSGNIARVDDKKRLRTKAVTESESLDATHGSRAYNINTGTISLTSSTVSGILYFKNNENESFILEALAVGVGGAGTTTESSVITLIRNPTTGTLISGASAVAMNQNRNFGTSNTLSDSLAYKGVEGSTVTDGDAIAQFFQGAGGRLFAGINFELQKGNSLAITIDTNTSSGTTIVYAALIGYLETI